MTRQWPGSGPDGTTGDPERGPALRIRADGRGFAVYLPEQAERGEGRRMPVPWLGYSMRGERHYGFDCYADQVWGPVWSPPIGPDTLAEVERLRAEVTAAARVVAAATALAEHLAYRGHAGWEAHREFCEDRLSAAVRAHQEGRKR